MRKIGYLLAVAGLIGILAIGCNDEKSKELKPVGGSTGENDHGHDHSHKHGKNNGEVFDIADTGLKVECVAKYGDDLILFYVFEGDGTTAKKIKCEQVSGSYVAGDVKTVTIPAVDLEEGLASRYEVEDQGFAIARKTTGVKIEFEIDGNKCVVDIPKDPH